MKTKKNLSKEQEQKALNQEIRFKKYALQAHEIEKKLMRLLISINSEAQVSNLESETILKKALNEIKIATRLLASGR